jgi:hypothetical protein
MSQLRVGAPSRIPAYNECWLLLVDVFSSDQRDGGSIARNIGTGMIQKSRFEVTIAGDLARLRSRGSTEGQPLARASHASARAS